ncbi:MAG: DUF1549 and DUF1553 domain-containing protein [Pirellula sp.]|nr:DUF1549 and DUF1553 domain-containing protein [Pirellula sp.]
MTHVVFLCALGCLETVSVADEPQVTEGWQLRVIPAHMATTPRYPAHFSVLSKSERGEVVDISHHPELQVRVHDPNIAQVIGGKLEYRSTGSSELEIRLKDSSLLIPISSEEDAPFAYDREITSVLTRSGCNLGTCHGNLHGKGGMRLSLRGDDPEFDFYRLAREFSQRRIDLWEPHESLLLKKGSGQVAHQGGKRFETDSMEYQWLLEWIQQGSPSTHASPLVALDISPKSLRVAPGTRKSRLIVQAKFADGSIRDVTRWARIEPSIPSGVQVSEDGWIQTEKPMDVSFSATYLSGRASSRFVFLQEAALETLAHSTVRHPLDAKIDSQCVELNITPLPPADDWTFIRRLYLVTVGRMPTPNETLTFVEDRDPDKVPKTVDRLLADPAFDFVWAMRWSDLIRNEDKVMSPKGAALLHGWIRQQIASDRSMQSWISELVSSVGSTYDHPPASYHRTHRDPFTTSESAAQVFLGVRIQCAKCHNHPFDVWKQDDYYGLAAYFTTVERKQIDNKPKDELDKHIITGDEIISLADRSPEIQHPGRSKRVPPRPLATSNALIENGLAPEGTILEQFGRWLTHDNPQFDANIANRIWYQYFGRGIVDPPDDFRDSNPPTNPELLAWLARELRNQDYSLKKLSRVILCSAAFARQSGVESPDASALDNASYFAAYPMRRIAAEVLLDAVSDACESFPQVHPGYEEGSLPIRRAMEMPGVPSKKGFLKTFGKPDRLLVCECERTSQVSLGQSLALVNGKEVRERIAQPNNRIGRLVTADIPFEDKVRELFLSALSRLPSDRELQGAVSVLNSSQDRPKNLDEIALAIQQQTTIDQYRERRALEDILWALMNSKEFSILR